MQSVTLLLWLCLCVATVCSNLVSARQNAPLRIAVIGSGIAGSSFSHFLHEDLQSSNIAHQLTVYERSTHIGGRTDVIHIGDHTIESGASIIHGSNQYLYNFTERFGIARKQPAIGAADNSWTGIWDGQQFVFSTSTYDSVTAAKIVWRYGLSYNTLSSSIQAVASKFWQLYPTQFNHIAFSSPAELLAAVGLYNYTQQSTADYLQQNNLPPDALIVKELVAASVRVNYGQPLNVNALAGAVGTIPLVLPSVFQVDNAEYGNAAIHHALLNASQAQVHTETAVQRIIKQKDNTYIIETNSTTSNSQTFDFVIIATPLELTDIEFTSSDSSVQYDYDVEHIAKRSWTTTYTTFVRGTIDNIYFGVSKPADVPPMILTTENDDVPFSSMTAYTTPDSENLSVYKIFSRNELTDAVLQQLFIRYDKATMTTIPWKAYPKFNERETFVPFQLDTNLFYVNAFENSVSCMESQVVAAKNVALLAAQQIKHNKIPSQPARDIVIEAVGHNKDDTNTSYEEL